MIYTWNELWRIALGKGVNDVTFFISCVTLFITILMTFGQTLKLKAMNNPSI